MPSQRSRRRNIKAHSPTRWSSDTWQPKAGQKVSVKCPLGPIDVLTAANAGRAPRKRKGKRAALVSIGLAPRPSSAAVNEQLCICALPLDPREAAKKRTACALSDIPDIDAVVNSAASGKMGGGTDRVICSAAGCADRPGLRSVGSVNVTAATGLSNVQCVFHTLAAKGSSKAGDAEMKRAYDTCFAMMDAQNLRTILIPSLGTSNFGFPKVRAAHIALDAARRWLESRAALGPDFATGNLVIFVPKDSPNIEVYRTLADAWYFPRGGGAADADDVVPEAGRGLFRAGMDT